MESDKLIPIGETARLLGVSVQTLRRWDNNGILKSFRAGASGKRFYKQQDVKVFLNDLPAIGWKWVSQAIPAEPIRDFYCRTSDVFTARFTRLENDLIKTADLGIHHSLLALMIAEIGENSYAHNLGNWPDIQGIFFAYDLNKRVIVLADRGRGILETLKFVRPELQSHRAALQIAFTDILSGRPGQGRGKGLKAVKVNILASDVKLTFRTGDAQLDLKRGDQELNIIEYEPFHGCFAVLNF